MQWRESISNKYRIKKLRLKKCNGLEEGSVNKIKLTKRIMYGRNSFLL